MRGDKANKIRQALADFGNTFNDREIAEMTGTTQSFVYKLRTKEKVKERTTRMKVTKKAKEQAIAKNAELGKKIVRRGRPPKAVVETQTNTNNLKDAIAVMMDLVAKYKDLFISFDSKRQLVEFMWQEEVYQVAPQEVDQLLSAMKYLDGKKLAWQVE